MWRRSPAGSRTPRARVPARGERPRSGPGSPGLRTTLGPAASVRATSSSLSAGDAPPSAHTGTPVRAAGRAEPAADGLSLRTESAPARGAHAVLPGGLFPLTVPACRGPGGQAEAPPQGWDRGHGETVPPGGPGCQPLAPPSGCRPSRAARPAPGRPTPTPTLQRCRPKFLSLEQAAPCGRRARTGQGQHRAGGWSQGGLRETGAAQGDRRRVSGNEAPRGPADRGPRGSQAGPAVVPTPPGRAPGTWKRSGSAAPA